MLSIVSIQFFTLIIFVALVINIAKNQQENSSNSMIGIAALLSILGGIYIYGYAYSVIWDNNALAIVKASLATLGMFLGKHEYADIKELDFMQPMYMKVVFWTVHLLAFYATTNAFLATIGAKALKHIRIWLKRFKKNLVIIYGVNKYSIAFGSELSNSKDNSIIYIDKRIDADYTLALSETGCLHYLTKDAVFSSAEFLKNIGVSKNKKVAVYVLGFNEAENFEYAIRLKKALEQSGIDKSNTSITLIANMEMHYGEALQAYDDMFGFGNVKVIDRAYLTANTLVNNYPPCNYVKFDTEKGRAMDGESFNAVIVGFGKVGQAVLKNIVINGQFEGCDFRVTVFDPKHMDITGYLYKNSRSMMEEYNIDLKSDSAMEMNFYKFIESNCKLIDYIVVCTGDEEVNAEITGDIQSTMHRLDSDAAIFQCSYDSVIHIEYDMEGSDFKLEVKNLYTSDTLDVARADLVAMELNHAYCGGKSAREDWNMAKFFDRMSCRASASFAPAFLKMVGVTEDEVLNSNVWENLSEEQLENLAKTEHLRWCAFHYSFGFEKMPEDIFEEKCAKYLKEKEEKGFSKIAIQKDIKKYYHRCLVPWNDLDDLSEKVRQITGNDKKDYKNDDVKNVLLLKDVLRAARND